MSDSRPGCASSACGSFWKIAATVVIGDVVGDRVEGAEGDALVEVDLPGNQLGAHRHLRPAHQDRDLEAELLVGAVDHRLVAAAVLGLGEPAGAHRHGVGGVRRAAQRQRRECRRRPQEIALSHLPPLR